MCQFSEYIGSDDVGLNQYLVLYPLCRVFYDQKAVTTGSTNNTLKATSIRNGQSPFISSFMVNNYSTTGRVNHSCLNIQDDTIEKQRLKKRTPTTTQPRKVYIDATESYIIHYY